MADFKEASGRIDRLRELADEHREALIGHDFDTARKAARDIKEIMAWLDGYYDETLIKD